MINEVDPSVSLVGVVVLVGVLVAATGFGLGWRRRTGRLAEARNADAPTTLSGVDIAAELGNRATLVQFSSAFCHPCIATRHVLAAAAAAVPGVRHVEIDAESHLDLVRRLRIASTPTTLVLDRTGAERLRARGVPKKADVLQALASLPEPQ